MDMLLNSNRIKIRAFPLPGSGYTLQCFWAEIHPKSIFAAIPNAHADFATNWAK
ncbi:hypothetical protein EZS27_006534 [termite gut metagenome]|uniref:Uncharacterized protein n=1 Tax=termite gut metagenome TaxID=433724 RepID=A0A5J4SJK0_9ZZZZ